MRYHRHLQSSGIDCRIMKSPLRSSIDLLAGVAMILTAGVVLWAKFNGPAPGLPPPPPPPGVSVGPKPSPGPLERLPKEPQPLHGAVSKGAVTARIGIIEYADFECPACAGFMRKTYGELMAAFVDTGRVRFFFRHFPLPNHEFARPAAIAAHCAGEQGRFWQFYERVFRLQPRLDELGLKGNIQKVGVDLRRWSSCVQNERAVEAVDADFESARGLELRGTPSFLIGVIDETGKLLTTARLRGAQDLPAFRAAIENAEKTVRVP